MKRLIACLLAVVMLCTAASAFAEPSGAGRFGEFNVVRQFLKETDLQTKDIALQIQSGDSVSELVIRAEGNDLHLVTRDNAVESGHVQLNSTGIYLGAAGTVTLLRYATVATVLKDIVASMNSMLEQAIQSIPEEALPSKAEIKEAVNQFAALASAAAAQEQADAATLNAAALAFVNKFKPEYILDVKEDAGSVAISLRSDAFATALAEAVDEMMLNPDLAELADRKAAQNGGKTFAEAQKAWLKNREATLDAIRSIESSAVIEENGHFVSHFQIGEELSEMKILVCDADAWIDAENGEVNIVASLGFKDEAPLLVYELAANADAYLERLTAVDSMAEIQLAFENEQISRGTVLTVIEGNEELKADFGPDHLYIKGPKGGISTTVRETWSGKLRYELVVETAEGAEASITLDFYQEDDSLVGELSTSESDQSVMFKLSRIDKLSIEDLSASQNINEITVDMIKAGLGSLLKLVANIEAPASEEMAEEAATMTENENAEVEEIHVTLPEDNGMAGVYKWIEMENYGLDTYLILWDDGIGSTDIVGTGTVRGVFYDDETMQVADEGTVPQKYTYADDKLIWTYTDESGEHVSTFVKLTAEERAAYEALGVGTQVDH